MGQRRKRLDYRKVKNAETRVKNAPQKAKNRIRNEARRADIAQRLAAAGY